MKLLKSFYVDPRRVAPLLIIGLFMAVTIGHVAAFAGSFERQGWEWLDGWLLGWHDGAKPWHMGTLLRPERIRRVDSDGT